MKKSGIPAENIQAMLSEVPPDGIV